MNLANFIDFLRLRLKTVIRVCWVALGLLLAWSVLFVKPEGQPGEGAEVSGFLAQAHALFEKWPVLWAIFGFIGCAVIIFASKAFGHAGIMTREDYYDE